MRRTTCRSRISTSIFRSLKKAGIRRAKTDWCGKKPWAESTQLPARNPQVRAWADLDDTQRQFYVRLQAAYAGMLEHTDEHIGRLLAALDALEQSDNTLIMLISDSRRARRAPLTVAMRCAIQWGTRYAEDNLPYLDEIGQAHLNNNYPTGWAMAGNTPLKRYKQNTHGGGVRDPLIVRWPDRIRDAGGVRRQFHHVCDLTPTVLDVIGIQPPAEIGGVTQQPLEGKSLAYSFDTPDAPTPKEAQYFEMLGHRGIWYRGWKAVTWHNPRTAFDEDQWELYHVDEDFNEVSDLATEMPEKLREMIDRWWIEAGRYNVLPLIGQQNRFSVASPHGLGKRSRQVLLPGGQRIPGSAAPDLRNRSFSITAGPHSGRRAEDYRCAG